MSRSTKALLHTCWFIHYIGSSWERRSVAPQRAQRSCWRAWTRWPPLRSRIEGKEKHLFDPHCHLVRGKANEERSKITLSQTLCFVGLDETKLFYENLSWYRLEEHKIECFSKIFKDRKCVNMRLHMSVGNLKIL